MPRSYETFVDILKHGRDKLTLENVFGALNSKELQQKLEGKAAGDVLAVRRRAERRDFRPMGKSRSKSRNGRKPIKCLHCHEEGHISRKIALGERENPKKDLILKFHPPYVTMTMIVQMYWLHLA